MDADAVPAPSWEPSWFMITGCQRSGTTLMRLVLECHSEIECRDEVIAYGLVSGRRTTRRERRLLGLKVPCLAEQFAAPRLFDAAWVPDVPNGYDGHSLVFMVRDVRDTVVSMLGLNVFGRAWLERALRPTLHAKLTREPDFAARYQMSVDAVESSRFPDLAAAAFYWRYKTEAVFDYLRRGFPVLIVRYEDFVARPESELRQVCDFLQIPWEPALLDHPRFTHRELDSRGIAMGGTEARRPIDGDSVGRWRQMLTMEQAEEVLAFAGEPQVRFYGQQD